MTFQFSFLNRILIFLTVVQTQGKGLPFLLLIYCSVKSKAFRVELIPSICSECYSNLTEYNVIITRAVTSVILS